MADERAILKGELTDVKQLQSEIRIPDLIKGEQGNDGKSAYQIAVDAGYQGSINDWLEDLRSTVAVGEVTTGAEHTDVIITNKGTNKDVVLDFTIPRGASAKFGTPTAQVTTLDPGNNATVSVNATGDNETKVFNFTFGIPKGYNGDFDTPAATATQLAEGAQPTVSVTASGASTAKKFSFAFGIPKGDTGAQGPKGDKGDKGDQGEQGPAGPAGANGASPVRGTDYWTDEDKVAMLTDLTNIYTGQRGFVNGVYDYNTGAPTMSVATGIMAPLVPITSAGLLFTSSDTDNIWFKLAFYDAGKNYLGKDLCTWLNAGTVTPPANAAFVGFSCEDTNDTTIKLFIS